MVSDCGPQFPRQVWHAFSKGLGASVSLSSGFHPQTNDQTERTNQDLESALRCVASSNPLPEAPFFHGLKYTPTSWSAQRQVCPLLKPP